MVFDNENHFGDTHPELWPHLNLPLSPSVPTLSRLLRMVSVGELRQALMRGHFEIENRLFYVKDDGFGEDRQVLQHHHNGLMMSLLLGAGLTLLRGNCPLWSDREPLTGRAQRLAAQPSATFAPSHTRL